MADTLEVYEYAGFRYYVRPAQAFGGIVLDPVPGQHHAASKTKHIMAARQCYLDDQKAKKSA